MSTGYAVERGSGRPPTAGEVERGLREEGLSPRSWSNGPGDTYDWHDHADHKSLWCLEGGIVFHLDDGDVELSAGDRLELPPGTRHAATVGPRGVHCVEVHRPVP
jgi:quercetin dioxygenase-like cupin family protein